MTQTNHNVRKTNVGSAPKPAAKAAGTVRPAAVKKPAAAKKTQRDPYDEFLENAEKAEKGRKTAAVKAAPAARKSAPGQTAEKSPARKPVGAAKPSVSATAKKKRAAEGDFLVPWDELETVNQKKKATEPKVKPVGKTASKPAAAPGKAASGSKPAEAWKKAVPGSGVDAASGKASPEKKTAASRNKAATENKAAASGKKPAQNSKAASAKKPDPRMKKSKARDEYDDFLDQAENARPVKRGNTKAWGATIALLVCIGGMLSLAGWQYTRYQTFLTMKAAVDRTTFYEGITVEGVSVENMTLNQALEHWQTSIEPGYSQRKVVLSNGAEFTAQELGYSSDYAAVLTAAWSAGRSGSLVDRYEALAFRKNQPASYNVNRIPYKNETVVQCAEAIAGQIDRSAKNSHIESFDTTSYQFRFTDEVVGSQLDQEKLVQDMTAALDAGGGNVELKVLSIQPKVRKDDIAGKYGMIASAVTNASSSSSNRLANIRLAAQIINGTCLKPGETFSFNGVVGERTEKRGFKTATAYSGGKVVEDVGGGICQVSTTLFNAAVKADMKIVERHNHSLTVGYVDKGKDAAVDWGNQDLRFTNNTDDNVYIACLVTDDKRVRFGIFGKLLPNGESITVEGVTTGQVPYETVMQPSMVLAPGQTNVIQSGKVGYKAEAYKIRWDANGKQISRELLCKSTYRATSEIIEFGP